MCGAKFGHFEGAKLGGIDVCPRGDLGEKGFAFVLAYVESIIELDFGSKIEAKFVQIFPHFPSNLQNKNNIKKIAAIPAGSNKRLTSHKILIPHIARPPKTAYRLILQHVRFPSKLLSICKHLLSFLVGRCIEDSSPGDGQCPRHGHCAED